MEKLMIMVMLTFATIIMSHIPSLNSAKPPPPFALYVFGDSLFDSGNNNLLPTLAKANFYPYGMNFPGGATGRFTNGRTVVDFIAEFLGLPYAPPYESLLRAVPPLGQLTGLLLRSDQLTGLNFASGSCGIFDETGSKYGKCLSLVDQINFFEKIVQQDLPKYYQNSDELSNYLSKSLFVISSGSNDYLNNYIDILNKNSSSSVAKLLINKLSPQLERMYKLGARKVIMFEIGPIGCIPSVTRQFKHNRQCAEEVNKLAVTFNDQLAPMLQNLSSTLEGSDFVLGHANWLGYDAIINPSKYGLIDSTNPCCKSFLNGTSGCIPGLGALACDYPEKNYFWDGYHPTETVYKTIASLCFNGSSVCIPKSIAQLVLQA